MWSAAWVERRIALSASEASGISSMPSPPTEMSWPAHHPQHVLEPEAGAALQRHPSA